MATRKTNAENDQTVLGHLKALRPYFAKRNWESHTKHLGIEVANELRKVVPEMVAATGNLINTRARQSASGETAGLRAAVKRLEKEKEELVSQLDDQFTEK